MIEPVIKSFGRSTSDNVQKAIWMLEETGQPFKHTEFGGKFGGVDTAEELHTIGIVDLLVEDGEGEHCVDDYIRRHRRRRLGHQGMFRVRQHCNPLAYDDLLGVVDIWVESALCLTKRDLRMMRRLARAQNRVGTVEEEGNLIAAF